MVEIRNPNQYGPLDPDQLHQFEQRIGVKLPKQYRQFLLQFNGGVPEPCGFELPPDNGSRLHVVYGLHDGPGYARLDRTQEIFVGRIPSTLLPIASDDLGNQICIGVGHLNRGRIYFWDHELEGSPQAKTKLASSFDKFIHSLFQHPEPNLSHIGFAWFPNSISVQIKREGYFGHHLLVEQSLPTGVGGWTMSRFQLPEQWNVISAEMDLGLIKISVEPNKTYYIGPHNFGSLTPETYERGDEFDAKLAALYEQHAVKPPD